MEEQKEREALKALIAGVMPGRENALVFGEGPQNPKLMLIGEAPCTKDLISCTDHDFEVVSLISIIAIFLIIALVLRSISLPVILVAVIETAIAANLCIPYYTNVTLPFVAPILISTIQLGSTVDYAILMTTRYKVKRVSGKSSTVSRRLECQSMLVYIGNCLINAYPFDSVSSAHPLPMQDK